LGYFLKLFTFALLKIEPGTSLFYTDNHNDMFQKILKELRDRPMLSIFLCVVLSEIIQLFITLISKRPPAFHYGIAVMALLMFFVLPVLLSIVNKKNGKKTEGDDQPDGK